MDSLQYVDPKSKAYSRIMKRKQNWEPFGKALVPNEGVTTIGSEVFMDTVPNSLTKLRSVIHKFSSSKSSMLIAKNENPFEKDNAERWKYAFDNYHNVIKKVTLGDGRVVSVPVNVKKYGEAYDSKKKMAVNYSKTTSLESLENNSNNADTELDTDPKIYVPLHLRTKNKNSEFQTIQKKLIIRNLEPNFMEDNIADYVEVCGDIQDITILRDKYTGDSRCIAFVNCYQETTAKKIIEQFHKKPMGSMIVSIDYAIDKKKPPH
jgi:hypothetical protein